MSGRTAMKTTGASGKDRRAVEKDPVSQRRRLPRRERREQFLDVAAEVLLEKGPNGLTMESLAAHAGVSKGLGYAYFKDVDDVLLTLIDREVGKLLRRVREAIVDRDSFEDKIRTAVRTYFEVASGPQGNLLGILRQAMPGPFEKQRFRTTLPLEKFWADLVFEEFDVPPRVAEVMADVGIGVANQSVLAWLRLKLPREQVEETCSNFILAGFRGAFPLRRPRGKRSALRTRQKGSP